MDGFSSGDTAWVLVSTAMVLLMTPGVAFFYGGMVRVRSVLNTLMMSLAAMAIVSVLWVLFGYTIAFGHDVGGGLVGALDHVGMRGILPDSLHGSIPTVVFAGFQLMFAIITVALISGAITERTKFISWCLVVTLWATLVYFPVAHWVFDTNDGHGGWIVDRLGAIDFAGGTAVHINAGVAALALVFVLGPRAHFRHGPSRPHNIPLVLLGAGLLWFGWFGFNAGSALTASGLAGTALLNTQVATAAGVLGWLVTEWFRQRRSTSLGAASGAIAGLVAITPACAAVTPVGAILVGAVAGVASAFAVDVKYRLGYDDSLDVVGLHFVAGLVGTLIVGLVASDTMTGGARGLLYGGGFGLLGRQAVAVLAVTGYSFAVTYGIGKAVDALFGLRVSPREEANLDEALHAETAYVFGPRGGPTDEVPDGTGVSIPGAAAGE